MKYWWVNQNQTHESEIGGGYLWSPKTKRDGGRNVFYDNMTAVEPGDIIFSFYNQHISDIGVAISPAYSSPKPVEFGSAGDYWNIQGWRLPVRFFSADTVIRPADHMEQIGPLLPSKYAPLQDSGRGNQGVYLAALPVELGRLLLKLCDSENSIAMDETTEIATEQRTDIPPTTKMQIIQARRGQGIFRDRLVHIEKCCRVTGLTALDFLVASHMKPWARSTDLEKLDGHNGLLLAPHIDRLFDRGFISFEDDGTLLVSPRLPQEVIAAWGIFTPCKARRFQTDQLPFVAYHRGVLFKRDPF
ncbi:hypothetical protein ASD50_03565 [Mesorhizobium sp. Root552]|jgi:hypothetical protein|uniref:HNH endonuclease n=1 Tax=Mesorhizobium sp. Root552 TaxID=1736555 RepID=UPI0006FB2E93|nr:HNH endonuclease signature motif containing protein [Mesorhizobium sp. Root552]KQZ26497.1 hypothetical protein ASD50_03565 [Mesorhizobium sp. Root552]